MGILWSKFMIKGADKFGFLNFSDRKVLAASYYQLFFNSQYPLIFLLSINDFYHKLKVSAEQKLRPKNIYDESVIGLSSEELISFRSSNKNITNYWMPFLKNEYSFITCSR